MMATAMRGEEGLAARAGERLAALLARKVPPADAGAFTTFAAQLLARARGYLTGMAEEEVAQLVLSAFRFFQAPGSLPRVRVLTPRYVDEGWDATHTVIETCVGDRPFIVDTVREELRAGGIEPRGFLHPILAVERDATGRAVRVEMPTQGARRESFLHVAIPQVAEPARQAALADAIRARLDDVVLVTEDYGPALARAQAMAADYEQLGRSRDPRVASDATATGDFLRWLVDGRFVFLGYREYTYADGPDGRTIQLRPGTGLGLMRREDRSAFRTPRPVATLPATAQRRAEGLRLLTVTKTRALAPVHRRAPMDDLGFAMLGPTGRVIGVRRFIGLFTSKAHAEEASEIPVLRRMVRQILAAEGAIAGSHDWKEIVGIFDTLPKGALFASSAEEVREDVRTILAAERTREVVVVVRERGQGDRVSVLVVMPRHRVSGRARARIAALVAQRLGAELLEDQLHPGGDADPDDPARLYLLFTRATTALDDDARRALERAIDAELESWPVRLRDVLVDRHGPVGAALALRWAEGFPHDYRATADVARAATDVMLGDRARRTGVPELILDSEPMDGATILRVYLAGPPLVLADFLPLLDHVGLRTLGEDRVRVTPADGGAPIHLHRFQVQDHAGRPLDVARVGARLVDTLLAVRAGRVPDDGLNALVVDAGLDWRAVEVLRAYAGYGVQAGLAARAEIWSTLVRHPEPARALFACFAARFGPAADEAAARAAFQTSLERVEALRDDQCLRALGSLVAATVRTNFYARAPECDRLVLKLRADDVPFLTDPRPRYELYVRAPIVEGLHLRAGAVARGGIRLSDRCEDYRTEGLGLMRTQTLKNAIIVPTGAKGAFVPRAGASPRDAYGEFVRGLLELTDDVVDGRVVHPPGLRIYDEEDPYLVVAADKGTGAFSDVANALALERGFWLGDAFASGGSHGYDHKALGITARGAWECVRTHFREFDVDADTAPLRMIGIGDMGGDVFGNGLLRSPHVRLLGAFDHRHVFLDPDPDPAASAAERARLFAAGAGWDQYDPAVRSPGAIVASRSAKRVALTPQVQQLLGVGDEALSGEALVRAVLGIEGDLLWNGGVGTYVRAPDEADATIGDPANDPVRVPSTALRVRVVAEGGNLGVTQRGRVAFALAGGRINDDAVDNSAGVDMSDHEVNLKICLAPLVAAGRLPHDARDTLLVAVRDDVAARVLAHNASQSRLLAVDERRSRERLDDFRAHLSQLERALGLDRPQLGLPDWETLRARRATSPGLTRPELAVVVAHTKIQLTTALRAAALLDEPFFERYLFAYFPRRLVTELPDAVRAHRLRREIVAAEVVNTLVDELGCTFVTRLQAETGASVVDVCRAWAIAWELADGAAVKEAIHARAPGFADEVACARGLEGALVGAVAWVLAEIDRSRPVAEAVADLGPGLALARDRLAAWLVGDEAVAFQQRRANLEMGGLAIDTARRLAIAERLTGVLDVVAMAAAGRLDVDEVGRRYYGLAATIDFAWLASALTAAADEDRWTRRVLAGVTEDLRIARRRLAARPLGRGGEARLAAVRAAVDEAKVEGRAGLPALVVVARMIRQLTEASA